MHTAFKGTFNPTLLTLTTVPLMEATSGFATGQTIRSIDWADRLVCVPDLTGALDIWELREEIETSDLSVSARLELKSRKSGGFSVVYKGKLPLGDGLLDVAVKIPRDALDASDHKYRKYDIRYNISSTKLTIS